MPVQVQAVSCRIAHEPVGSPRRSSCATVIAPASPARASVCPIHPSGAGQPGTLPLTKCCAARIAAALGGEGGCRQPLPGWVSVIGMISSPAAGLAHTLPPRFAHLGHHCLEVHALGRRRLLAVGEMQAIILASDTPATVPPWPPRPAAGAVNLPPAAPTGEGVEQQRGESSRPASRGGPPA